MILSNFYNILEIGTTIVQFWQKVHGWTLHMIMCVLLCYPVSIRTYYQQGVLFLVFIAFEVHHDNLQL